MTQPADSARLLKRGLVALGLTTLALITLSYPGATRMFAWPWSCAYAAVCATPILLLALRIFDSHRPMLLPGTAWTAGSLGAVAVVLLASLLSPWRGPALLWSAPLLAGVALFLVVSDWLHADPTATARRRIALFNAAGLFLAVVAVMSFSLWAETLSGHWRERIFTARNPFPLGHSNYTAGLALLMLPLFSGLAFGGTGIRRIAWLAGAILAVALIFSSGSRGGLLGLAVLALANVPAIARALRLRLWVIAIVAVGVLVALFYFSPRARTLLTGERPSAALRESNVQRSAMLAAGFALGNERPLLGWGAGTTPLAYPHVRARLEGGVEDVLQLHNTPVQLYAEFGALGLIVGLLGVVLAARAAWQYSVARPVFFGLLGYLAFSLTDWQLDVPVFTASLALACALIAPAQVTPPQLCGGVRATLVTSIVILALFARPDPAPELNSRALVLARDPAQVDAAAALFRSSLALNPDQEIAHFNLGWLLLTRDPTDAERHFQAAVHLVPDKGGVYFGLALARLNQGNRLAAMRGLALECINDPLFLVSPWWRTPALADLRAGTLSLTTSLLSSIPMTTSLDGDRRYLSALIDWLEGRAVPGAILAAANTSDRVGYFARRPARPDFSGPLRVYRRERTGYPVLMRNLDLPVPTDLFDVQENLLAATELNFLFPRKGWLPAPLLLPLLDSPVSNPKS